MMDISIDKTIWIGFSSKEIQLLKLTIDWYLQEARSDPDRFFRSTDQRVFIEELEGCIAAYE